MKITYLGHSCFEIETENKTILIDPFLIMSPNYNYNNVSEIFVTHGHGDHIGNAIEISLKNHARITGIFELANYCAQKKCYTNGIGLGSWIEFPFGKVIAVPAFHSSSSSEGIYTGNPCGFIFEIENKKIYHAGDTGLNTEMKMIGELYKPDYAMLPIGGHYTMDIEHATIASKWLNCNNIIPMHYNTFDAISVNINDFETKIKEIGKNPIIMNIEDSLTC